MGISDSSARQVVRGFLAQKGLWKGRLSEDGLSMIDFAIELRRVIAPGQHAATFARRRDALAYVQMVATLIREVTAPDKSMSWVQERALQDQKHGYRLLAKQQRARRTRLTLREQHQQRHAEAQRRYGERMTGVWPIIKSGRESD
jgi:hypothetical protein